MALRVFLTYSKPFSDLYTLLRTIANTYILTDYLGMELVLDDHHPFVQVLGFGKLRTTSCFSETIFQKALTILNLRTQWRVLLNRMTDVCLDLNVIPAKDIENLIQQRIPGTKERFDDFFRNVVEIHINLGSCATIDSRTVVLFFDDKIPNARFLYNFPKQNLLVFCRHPSFFWEVSNLQLPNARIHLIDTIEEEMRALFMVGEGVKTMYRNNHLVASLPLFLSTTQRRIRFITDPPRVAGYYEDLFRGIGVKNQTIWVTLEPSFFLMSHRRDDFLALLQQHSHFLFSSRRDQPICTVRINNTHDPPLSLIDDSGMFQEYSTLAIEELHASLHLQDFSRIALFPGTPFNAVNRFFPDVFVIHLSNDLARIKNLLILEDMGVRYHLVDAIGYRESPEVNRFTDFVLYRNLWDDDIFKENRFHTVSKGSVCLTLTNELILSYCLENGITQFLILEDDVLFHKNYAALLEKHMTSLPPDWNIIQLGSKQGRKQPPRRFNTDWNVPNKFTWATHSYALRDCAATVLGHLRTHHSPLDVLLQAIPDQNRFVSTTNLFITLLQDVSSNIQLNNETYLHWGWDIRYYVSSCQKLFSLGNHKERRKFGNGWDVVTHTLDGISPRSGSVFYDFMDDDFGWNGYRFDTTHNSRGSWYGIIHHPFALPSYFGEMIDVKGYLSAPNGPFMRYKHKCIKLFVLSQDLNEKITLSGLVPSHVPIVTLLHPIVHRPAVKFSWERYAKNPDKLLLAIGWSFRRLTSIFRVQAPEGLRKVWLTNGYDTSRILMRQIEEEGPCPMEGARVEVKERLTRGQYDDLLTENLVFLDFVEASANNAVVECIASHTPMIIRRVPAVVEYLGADYPLYFEHLDEVPRMLRNESLIQNATTHLENIEKNDRRFSLYFFFQRLYNELN